jgi:hypothetical protein
MTDIPSGKVPVVECVVAAWRFFLQNWQRFLPAAVITGVVSGGVPVLLTGGAQSPQNATFANFAVFAVTAVAGVFFTAAVLRKAVRDEYQSPTGLTLGPDETRLLGVLGAMALLFLPPVFLFSIVLVIVLFGRIASSPEQLEALMADEAAMSKAIADALSTPAGMMIQLLGLVFLVFLVIVSARLIMVNAAAIGEGRIVFFQTWSWSKGNVFRIVAAMILTALPVWLFNLILNSILAGTGAAQNLVAAIVVNSGISIIAALGSIPSIALGAQLYKGLRPPDFVAK